MCVCVCARVGDVELLSTYRRHMGAPMATITRFIIRIFLSPRALFPLSLVGIYRGPRRILLPILLPFHERFLYLSTTASSFTFRPSLPIDVYTSSRCPLFLIDDLNFWIYFGSRLRFVPPRSVFYLPFAPFRIPKPSLAPRYYLLCRCLIETVIVFSNGTEGGKRKEDQWFWNICRQA